MKTNVIFALVFAFLFLTTTTAFSAPLENKNPIVSDNLSNFTSENFNLYIRGHARKEDKGCEDTGNWTSVSIQNVNPGKVYYTDFTLKGPFVSDRKAVIDWINNTTKGSGRERTDMTLVFHDDKSPIGENLILNLKNNILSSYQPPAVSAGNHEQLEETVVIRPQRVVRTRETLCGDNNDAETSGRAANDSDKILFGGKFNVDIDGDPEKVTAASGAGVMIERNLRTFTISKVNWQNIVLEKNYVEGDRTWEEWFKKVQAGERELKNITLEYLNSEGDPSGRGWTAFDAYPVRYGVINIDSRAGSSSIKEVLELAVDRVEYQ